MRMFTEERECGCPYRTSHRKSAPGLTPPATSRELSLLKKAGLGPTTHGATFPASWWPTRWELKEHGGCGSYPKTGAQRRGLHGDLVGVVSTEGFLEEMHPAPGRRGVGQKGMGTSWGIDGQATSKHLLAPALRVVPRACCG